MKKLLQQFKELDTVERVLYVVNCVLIFLLSFLSFFMLSDVFL